MHIDMFLYKLARDVPSSGDVQESHHGGTFREGAEQGPARISEVGGAKVLTSRIQRGHLTWEISMRKWGFDGFNMF